MVTSRMRRFWDARAREDALHFSDDRLPYREADPEDAWRTGGEDLDALLRTAGVSVRQNDVVLDLGCGVGRLTRALAHRAAHVIALDVSPEMLRRAQELNDRLNNVTWLLGDGESLTGVEDASVDGAISHVVFEHVPEAKVTLGYVAELGRVLRPGGWAAFGLSTDFSGHDPAEAAERGTSRRDLLRSLALRAPRGQSHPAWVGAPVPLDALGAVAERAGLTLEQIEGSGTRHTLVRARRARRGGG